VGALENKLVLSARMHEKSNMVDHSARWRINEIQNKGLGDG
jgi:hypothetical protein